MLEVLLGSHTSAGWPCMFTVKAPAGRVYLPFNLPWNILEQAKEAPLALPQPSVPRLSQEQRQARSPWEPPPG